MSIDIDKTITADETVSAQVNVKFVAVFDLQWNAFTEEACYKIGLWKTKSDAINKVAPVKFFVKKHESIRSLARLDKLIDRITDRLDDWIAE